MLYLIGIGLNEKSISQQGLEAIRKCKKIYLESYTVDFPYSKRAIERTIRNKVLLAEREFIERADELLEEAKKKNIALLVYGSPLTATTHIALVQEAKRKKIKYEIIFNASIIDAIGETGLQLYKFGRISSMPTWQSEKHYQPDSFMEIVKENKSINAHSLILIDIGLEFSKALLQLEISAANHNFNVEKILACSKLGTKEKRIFYGTISELRKKKLKSPYCIIIPGKLHFLEEEVLKNF